MHIPASILIYVMQGYLCMAPLSEYIFFLQNSLFLTPIGDLLINEELVLKGLAWLEKCVTKKKKKLILEY